MTRIEALLRLSVLSYGIGARDTHALMSTYDGDFVSLLGDTLDTWSFRVPRLRRFLKREGSKSLWIPPQLDLDEMMTQLKRVSASLILYGDPEYPEALSHISDPPLVIYALGNLELLRRPHQLGVVGSRRMSAYGGRVISTLLSQMTGEIVIVSGAALGVDRHAHEQAMARGLSTIAVLGCGVDRVYPSENRPLYERLKEKNLLISEFPIGTGPAMHHFPKRNRIISGLTQGVVVVEAALKSGSLITARLSNESGRSVFAVPGPIDSPLQTGCHALIAEGARVCTSFKDIIEEIPDFMPYLKDEDCLPSSQRKPESRNSPENELDPDFRRDDKKSDKPDILFCAGDTSLRNDLENMPAIFSALYRLFESQESWHIDDLATELQTKTTLLFQPLYWLKERGYLESKPGQWYARVTPL